MLVSAGIGRAFDGERYIKCFFSLGALDQYVRRTADRIGLRAKKSRWRRGSVDSRRQTLACRTLQDHTVRFATATAILSFRLQPMSFLSK